MRPYIFCVLLAVGGWAFAQQATPAPMVESTHSLKVVMQHLGSSSQQIYTGLLTNNRLMIEHAANTIATYPAPKGGIAQYIKKDHDKLKPIIAEMDVTVRATAGKIASLSGKASMLELKALNDEMVTGCVSCHNVFRD